MKHGYFDRITSFILVLGILLPLIIGFAHVFHGHEHDICRAKTEQHIHSKKIDCLNSHYFTDIQYKDDLNYLKVFVSEHFRTAPTQLNSLLYLRFVSFNFERGPPSFNIF